MGNLLKLLGDVALGNFLLDQCFQLEEEEEEELYLVNRSCEEEVKKRKTKIFDNTIPSLSQYHQKIEGVKGTEGKNTGLDNLSVLRVQSQSQ